MLIERRIFSIYLSLPDVSPKVIEFTMESHKKETLLSTLAIWKLWESEKNILFRNNLLNVLHLDCEIQNHLTKHQIVRSKSSKKFKIQKRWFNINCHFFVSKSRFFWFRNIGDFRLKVSLFKWKFDYVSFLWDFMVYPYIPHCAIACSKLFLPQKTNFYAKIINTLNLKSQKYLRLHQYKKQSIS